MTGGYGPVIGGNRSAAGGHAPAPGTSGRLTEADDPAAAAVARVFRDERVAVLATLIRHVGDIQLAEDAVQDAFAAALGAWRQDGVPHHPGAWITVAARRRAIDRLRRESSQSERTRRLAELIRLDQAEEAPMTRDDSVIPDDRLRLIFTACHPARGLQARVALTLRVLGGLTTGEIARAFLVAEPPMGKRIVRAKRKIATARIEYRVPTEAELPERLGSVLRVTYVIFHEGYAASAGEVLVRDTLCAEAIHLGRLLCELLPVSGCALLCPGGHGETCPLSASLRSRASWSVLPRGLNAQGVSGLS